jgi:hypothetical protein
MLQRTGHANDVPSWRNVSSRVSRLLSCLFGDTEKPMTGSELIVEAERLTRPCVLLRTRGPKDRLAAVWGGPGLVSAPEDSFQHWLTVDCRFFPDSLGLSTGCLSVYTDEEHSASGAAALDPQGKLTVKRGSTKLYAHAARSLPPLAAVFQFGSSAVHRWLRSNGWLPEWG